MNIICVFWGHNIHMEKYTTVLKNWSIHCMDIFGTSQPTRNWKLHTNNFLKAN